MEKLEALRDFVRTKDADEINKYDNIHKNGSSCIEHLLFNVGNIVMPRTHSNIAATNLSSFDLKGFSKCTDIMLKVFIYLSK